MICNHVGMLSNVWIYLLGFMMILILLQEFIFGTEIIIQFYC